MTSRSRAGRVGPEALLIPVLVAALWVLKGGLGLDRVTDGRPPVAVDGPPAIDAWSGSFEADGGLRVTARLTPLHTDAEVQAYDARVLRARLGLSQGQPWRLRLQAEGEGAAELRVVDLRVEGADGVALAPPAVGLEDGPLGALLGRPEPSQRAPLWDLVLWGPPPTGALTVEGVFGGAAQALPLTLAPAQIGGDELPRGLGAAAPVPLDDQTGRVGRTGRVDGPTPGPALRAAQSRIAELEGRVAELTRELAESEDARIERERSFIDFQQRLAGLPDPMSVRDHVRAMLGLPPEEGTPEADAAAEQQLVAEEEFEAALDEVRTAARERTQTLNTLLRAEGVWAIELLESGDLIEGADPDDAAAVEGTGPVVFRQIDGDGRLAGGITAAALRLEGSRAGRSLTIVLSEGTFREGGQVRPFARGEHRIELEHVDPEPFMEALPELFRVADLERRIDDGLWTLSLVEGELNRLLAADTNGRRYRLAWLGGVLDGELR
ncbi:MAG: hypothetical protein AAFZ65_16760, partial [Planctomycetota bacterium]